MLDKKALDTLFNEARTYPVWQDKPVDDGLLKQLYDLTKMGPTSANNQPLRVVFVKSAAAKEKLKDCLDKGNVEKTMTAPVTAILGMDLAFYEHLDKLAPHAADAMKKYFTKSEQFIYDNAFRNGSIQGGYFILAARALGLDCGPMSGFDNAKVDAAFFAGTKIKSNFLCNLGHGDASKLHPRAPRLEFNEACKIV